MNRYAIKRKVLRPLTAWRRWRVGPTNPFNTVVFEAHDYRPAMQRFFATTRQHPDILVDVDLREGAVVLDVGAYEGGWSQRVLSRTDEHGPSTLQIHAFEPEPASIERFQEALGSDARVILHPFGLAGHDQQIELSVGGPGSSRFVDPGRPGWFGTTEVLLRDVDAVLTSLAIGEVDLVMMNIEGGEYELLDRLHETGWLRRIGTLFVQFHEFGPDAYRARRRNRRHLSETHACTWSYPWVFERWDRKA